MGANLWAPPGPVAFGARLRFRGFGARRGAKFILELAAMRLELRQGGGLFLQLRARRRLVAFDLQGGGLRSGGELACAARLRGRQHGPLLPACRQPCPVGCQDLALRLALAQRGAMASDRLLQPRFALGGQLVETDEGARIHGEPSARACARTAALAARSAPSFTSWRSNASMEGARRIASSSSLSRPGA